MTCPLLGIRALPRFGRLAVMRHEIVPADSPRGAIVVNPAAQAQAQARG